MNLNLLSQIGNALGRPVSLKARRMNNPWWPKDPRVACQFKKLEQGFGPRRISEEVNVKGRRVPVTKNELLASV